jgi:hypothetical protein
MRRRLFVLLISSVASVTASSLSAEDRGTELQLGGRLSRLREEKSRSVPPAELLIYQRAQRRARQRAELLEAYEWAGYSPARPTVLSFSAYGVDPNPRPWLGTRAYPWYW